MGSLILVLVAPERTQFTVMRWGASSDAIVRVIASSPPLVAV